MRSRASPPAPLHLAAPAALAVASALASAPAFAQAPEGFELQTVAPSPAGDRFFLAADGSVAGDGTPYAKLFGGFAYKPLLSRGTREFVSSQLLVNLGGAYAIDKRWLVGLDVPFFPVQTGNDPDVPEGAHFGDVRVTARAAIVRTEPISFGPELRFSLPTGSPDSLTGDELPRGSLHLAASGRVSLFAYAANAGVLVRERRTLASAEVGTALPFAAAAGLVLADDKLLIGTEFQGHTVLSGEFSTPIVGLLDLRYRVGSVVLGAGLGPGLTRALGAGPRVVLSVAWEPEAEQGETGAPPPEPAPAPGAAPSPAPQPAEPPPAPAAAPSPAAPPPPPSPTPPPAPAPAPPAMTEEEARVEARRLFSEGVQAFDSSRFAEAATAFGKAYALRPHPAVLRNLAQSELMAGQKETACQHFKKWKAETDKPSAADLKQVEDGIQQACR